MSKAIIAWFLLIAWFPSVAVAQGSSQAETPEQKIVRSLNWIKGPQSVPLFGYATFAVPAGYQFLNPADTTKFMEVIQNPSNGREYLFAPQNLRWFAILEFVESGYVRDDEKIDADAVLASIRQGTEESNKIRRAKGWGTMTVTGWKLPPRYDTEFKRLEWAIDGRTDTGESVINLNTRILGRRGVTSAKLVTDPETLDSDVREFKTALTGYSYNGGEQYHEVKAGDKMAEYGLAALILGGAAAVATKKGWWAAIAAFLAAFWKIIAGIAVALIAGLGSIFRRKKS